MDCRAAAKSVSSTSVKGVGCGRAHREVRQLVLIQSRRRTGDGLAAEERTLPQATG
jgi:hypothetical protein